MAKKVRIRPINALRLLKQSIRISQHSKYAINSLRLFLASAKTRVRRQNDAELIVDTMLKSPNNASISSSDAHTLSAPSTPRGTIATNLTYCCDSCVNEAPH